MLGYDDDDDDDDDDKWNVMIEEKDAVNEVENEWAITAIGQSLSRQSIIQNRDSLVP